MLRKKVTCVTKESRINVSFKKHCHILNCITNVITTAVANSKSHRYWSHVRNKMDATIEWALSTFVMSWLSFIDLWLGIRQMLPPTESLWSQNLASLPSRWLPCSLISDRRDPYRQYWIFVKYNTNDDKCSLSLHSSWLVVSPYYPCN